MAQTEVVKTVSKFFKSNEFFPIDINFGDKEKIRITKRPRKAVTDIVDMYANGLHIGMFVGIEKLGKMLKFGPAGVNKSHSYRKILEFVFVKLLEYYGLNDINAIVMDPPENRDYFDFLIKLGFIMKEKRLVIELDGDKMGIFLKILEASPVEVASQVGQIEGVLRANLGADKEALVLSMTDTIADKIKNMDPIGKKFWDNRKVQQINVYLSTAVFHADKLWKKEYLESAIKTIITSFDTVVREAYMVELFDAFEGKKAFSMPYIQKMVEKMIPILGSEIKHLEKKELHEWIEKNLAGWKMNDKLQEETIAKIKADARLKIDDFGQSVKDEIRPIAQALVDHYNGENLFFGLKNRL